MCTALAVASASFAFDPIKRKEHINNEQVIIQFTSPHLDIDS